MQPKFISCFDSFPDFGSFGAYTTFDALSWQVFYYIYGVMLGTVIPTAAY